MHGLFAMSYVQLYRVYIAAIQAGCDKTADRIAIQIAKLRLNDLKVPLDIPPAYQHKSRERNRVNVQVAS